MFGDHEPFVLLDDAAAGGGASYAYTGLIDTIVATTGEAVPDALADIRRAIGQGHHVAGVMAYEAGHALEPGLRRLSLASAGNAVPLLWFGIFADRTMLARDAVAARLPDRASAWLGAPQPRIDRAAYDAAFARVADYIVAGDIYQANLSLRADVPFAGSPLALYARLRAAAAAAWGAIVFTGSHWLLSASPELFFRLDADGTITARPMKGTAPRGATPSADAAAARALAADEKERAENLMIVDLLRNDIARVAVAGSVKVPDLFTVETYPTLHTMTSSVTATAVPGADAIDVITALFPCGSITGAPKIRAIEVIAEVEADARHVYTGAIGAIDADGSAQFNVAIRTLTLEDGVARAGQGSAILGLGSAVVADSTADTEWRECLAKGAFVTHGVAPITLIETMRFEPGVGIVDHGRHQARLRRSARLFGIDDGAVGPALFSALASLDAAARVRLSLAEDGRVTIDIAPLPLPLRAPVAVALARLPVARHDFRLRHKTADRAFYDDARTASGQVEVAFVDPDGFVTEGSFTNVFVPRGGRLITPPLVRGLLPGILRERLIDEGRAIEADVTAADLADGFYVGNALRGLIAARLA